MPCLSAILRANVSAQFADVHGRALSDARRQGCRQRALVGSKDGRRGEARGVPPSGARRRQAERKWKRRQGEGPCRRVGSLE